MTWEAWFILVVVVGILTALVRNSAPTDVLMVAALTLIVAVGEVAKVVGAADVKLPTIDLAVAGMGNSGLITVGVLFVVVAGLVQTGAMELVAGALIGKPKTERAAQVRLMAPVIGLSAFLNNTPVVAMFMPVVEDICKRTRISPSKLYMPLAFAATFGGVCTLVGTSTNLIVHGLMLDAAKKDLIHAGQPGYAGFAMFDLAWVGVPCAVAGIVFFLLFSKWLLPERRPAFSVEDDPRKYAVDMIVQEGGPLVGKTIGQAGLRKLPKLFLAEIERGGETLQAVSPRELLKAGDRLVFVGMLESVADLQKLKGLVRAPDRAEEDESKPRRRLIEAVVADKCPLIGTSIREGQFRTVYDAAVVAVARGERRIARKIGDIVLRQGDTLLLEADDDFLERQRNSGHFHIIGGVEHPQPPQRTKAWLALAILVGMIGFSSAGVLNLLTAAFIASGLMIATGCCSLSQARQSVDWPLLVVIAASLGIGKAIESSGLALFTAQQIIGLAGGNEWLVLLAVYLVGMVFTELVTNNAAAVLVFPIALQAAVSLEASPMPFMIALAVAASAGFATPFGYQTNLMVYGPGGYKFTDYVKVGLPLDFLFLAVTVALTPLVWPF